MSTVCGIPWENRANAGRPMCKPTLDMSKEARSQFLDVCSKLIIPAVFNSATDLILTVMPLTIFWTLQMDLKIKLGLAGLLGLSVLYVPLPSPSFLKKVSLTYWQRFRGIDCEDRHVEEPR